MIDWENVCTGNSNGVAKQVHISQDVLRNEEKLEESVQIVNEMDLDIHQ